MTLSSLNPSRDENAPTREESGRSDRGAFVVTMIAIAALLFLATEALLYYRWATMTEPTCVLVVEAGKQLTGAEVTVSGVTIEPYKVKLVEGGRFALPFYLEPGLYKLKVVQNDQTIFEHDVELTNRERGKRFNLSKLPPASPSTTDSAPATRSIFP